MPYQDEKGHFTTKENDGGPCKHESPDEEPKAKKAIRGGKYLIGDREVTRDEWDAHDGPEEEMDVTTDEDFEIERFDAEGDLAEIYARFDEWKEKGTEETAKALVDSIADHASKEKQMDFAERWEKGASPDEIEEWISDNLGERPERDGEPVEEPKDEPEGEEKEPPEEEEKPAEGEKPKEAEIDMEKYVDGLSDDERKALIDLLWRRK